MIIGNRFMFGLAVGVCTGAMAGMLVAPKSGAETRKALNNRAGNLKNRIREMDAKKSSVRA